MVFNRRFLGTRIEWLCNHGLLGLSSLLFCSSGGMFPIYDTSYLATKDRDLERVQTFKGESRRGYVSVLLSCHLIA